MHVSFTTSRSIICALAITALAGCDDGPDTTVQPDGNAVADTFADTAVDTGISDTTSEDAAVSDVELDQAGEGIGDMFVPDTTVLDTSVPDVGPDTPDVNSGCPPTGPFGHAVGDTLTNYTLMTCDDEPYDVHNLCGSNAALVFNFYGW